MVGTSGWQKKEHCEHHDKWHTENIRDTSAGDRAEGTPGHMTERTEGVSRQMMTQKDTWTGDRAEGTPGHMIERTEGCHDR